jgi:hypothetical protein
MMTTHTSSRNKDALTTKIGATKQFETEVGVFGKLSQNGTYI